MTTRRDAGRLPVGTVTFLRTDVEGSMGWVRRLGSGWDDVNAAHLAIVRRAIEDRGGVVVRTEGDACFAAFAEARAAAEAAADIQRQLAGATLPDAAGLAVRVGLHSGEAHRAGDDYGGFEVNRAARIAATGHGGQIVVSDTTRALIADELPAGTYPGGPRDARPARRAPTRAAQPAQHRRAARDVPAAAHRWSGPRQPARAADLLPRARRARGAVGRRSSTRPAS